MKKNNKRLTNIINALARHEDSSAIAVLEKLGTNCENDEVRRITAKALVNRNSPESLAIVINEQGKGINDLNTNVAMSAINDILSLKNKEEAVKLLSETEVNHEQESVRETAHSIKALIEFC